MASVSRIISIAVSVVCFIIFFAIIRIGLSLFNKTGPDQFSGVTGSMIQRLWSFVSVVVLTSILWIIVIIMLCIYVVWKIIKKFVPNFPIPFKKILLKIPPFPQLERARIFALFDGVFGILLGRGTIFHRFVRFGENLADFVTYNGKNIIGEVKGRVPKVGETTSAPPEEEAEDNKNSAFSDAERQMINEQMQQCIEEKVIPITPEMSTSEATSARAANVSANLTCQVAQLQSFANLMSFK